MLIDLKHGLHEFYSLLVDRRAAEQLRQELQQLLFGDRTDLDEVARERAPSGLLLECRLREGCLVDDVRLEQFLADVFDHCGSPDRDEPRNEQARHRIFLRGRAHRERL